MDGLPVTIRLIDPPLHEFLPDLTELSVKVARQEDAGQVDERDRVLLDHVRRLHEQNPMLGLRGVRLGILIPGLFEMQARAILEAAADRKDAGGDPQPEIMIPLVASVREFEVVQRHLETIAAEVIAERGQVPYKLGTMIELPRAAILADRVARSAEFFSFGTNDLTQMTWGFSRDDVEASFFSTYLENGIFDVSPFESLDILGVGEFVRIGTEKGRSTRPDLHVGVCGEHGGDPLLHPLLPRGRSGLRLLLTVPGPGGPARGRARRAGLIRVAGRPGPVQRWPGRRRHGRARSGGRL